MLTEEKFSFFHRVLFLVTKLRLHPFTVRNDLLVDAESKGKRLIGWSCTILNILYLPFVASRIKESGKIEGVVLSCLFLASVAALILKMTILMYHSELIQVANNAVLLNGKLGKKCFIL